MRHFGYLIFRSCSFVLLLAFLVQPIAPLFASETPEETGSETYVAESAAESTDTPDEAEPVEAETTQSSETAVSEEEILELIEESIEPAEEILSETPPAIEEESSGVPDTGSTSTPLGDDAPSIAEEVMSSTTNDSTDEEAIFEPVPAAGASSTAETAPFEEGTTTPSEPIVDTEVPEPPQPEPDDDSATSTEPAPEYTHYVTNDENRFSFAKNECTAVGDGTYYCATPEDSPALTGEDRIFAAPDADGDKEIFMEREGEVTALTDNAYEDEAPFYDEVSESIVWHRLVEGRYQIISLDLDTNEEIMLTEGRTNSMQPARFGETTVWQGWVGDDWEVFMLLGDEEQMLTDNVMHDIMPQVNGSHIVWQSFEGNAWHMKVYDIRTGTTETVEATEGGSIQNPRFVLVYDTKYGSGDVETKGYDLESGDVIDLGSTPAPVPREIPDPEQTGEERALVSPTQPKTKVDEDTDVPPTGEPENDLDVVVPPLVETTATTTHDGIEDVVLEPVLEENGTQHIEELIVPPYTELESSEDAEEETII